MMRTLQFSLLLSSLLAIVSCNPTIDGSTEESYQSSVEKIKQQLPEEKKAAFEKALQLIAVEGLDFADLLQGEKGAEEALKSFSEAVDGLTAEEVIAKGDVIKAEKERKKKAQARVEIEELYQKFLTVHFFSA